MRNGAVAILSVLLVLGPATASAAGSDHATIVYQESERAFRVTESISFVSWENATAASGSLQLALPGGALDVVVSGAPHPIDAWHRSEAATIVVFVDGGTSGPVGEETITLRYLMGSESWDSPSRPGAATSNYTFFLFKGWNVTVDGHAVDAVGARFGRDGFTSSVSTSEDDATTIAFLPPAGRSLLYFYAGALVALIAVIGLAVSALRARRSAPRLEGTPLQHLGELSSRLRIVFLVLIVSTFAFFSFGLKEASVGDAAYFYPVPSFTENVATQVFSALAGGLVPAGVSLIVTSPTDAAFVNLEVAIFLGSLTTLPVLSFETAMFIGPALRREERRAVFSLVLPAIVLFTTGAAFAYFVLLPSMLSLLYAYAVPIGALQLLRVEDLVSFAVTTMLIFGLAFELPLIMAGLSRFGMIGHRTWIKYWRHVVVGIFVAAAIVTPDPSVVNQVLVAVPLIALYGLGIVAARAVSSKKGSSQR
ncbi:MAG: twin-arginine translocase subunit TatC [Euryarchaeota archaeon]|nr:twin-arginine translocase subunit TatC [Euryarchaeota archaeon]